MSHQFGLFFDRMQVFVAAKMEADKAFGVALRALRDQKGLSQQAFVGVVTREHLSRLERGVSQPNLQLVRELARVLDVHPLSLLLSTFHHNADALMLRTLMTIIANDLRIDLEDDPSSV